MKKTKIALAVAAATMFAAPAFATNGDNLMGLGVQSRAMGGTGTAANYGSENALNNPAMLGKGEGTEFFIGGIYFTPDVAATVNAPAAGGTMSGSSASDKFLIPEIALSHRINSNWTFGLGMYGVAGLGVDYDGYDTPFGGGNNDWMLFQGVSSLQLMKFVPSLTYNTDNFGIGVAPTLMYGALDLNYFNSNDGNIYGNGVSTDLGTGFNIGGYYDVTDALTVGLSYQSETSMDYDTQLTDAANGFIVGPEIMQTGFTNATGIITSDALNQPAEMAIGIAYDVNNNWMVTADAKKIYWSKAEGYSTFNWEDQTVLGLGVKYKGNGYWLGAGYNRANDPIDVLNPNAAHANDALVSGMMGVDMTGYSNQVINMFNNHFFPGVIETHFTFGGGYELSKNVTLEGAVTVSPEVTKTINVSQIYGDPNATHTVEHSQKALSFSVRMNF